MSARRKRSKRGRPLAKREGRTAQLRIRLRPSEHRLWKRAAREWDCEVSELVRTAVGLYLAERGRPWR